MTDPKVVEILELVERIYHERDNTYWQSVKELKSRIAALKEPQPIQKGEPMPDEQQLRCKCGSPILGREWFDTHDGLCLVCYPKQPQPAKDEDDAVWQVFRIASAENRALTMGDLRECFNRGRAEIQALDDEIRRLRDGLESLKQSFGLTAAEWGPKYVARIDAILGMDRKG